MTLLSPNFSLEELTRSQAAVRFCIANVPPATVIDNLESLAAVLERVRALLGNAPIHIDSGYRSPALNKRIGGAAFSAHCQGLAVDFICPTFGTPREICALLAKPGIPFDQLICEGTWVHLAMAAPGSKFRREVLTAVFAKGKPTTYLKGLV